MIIYRHGTKDKWVYKDAKDNVVTDKKILAYIKSLPPIPPAYKDVEIFYTNGPKKIIFQGYDDKGRLQQIYSAAWREKADKKKFNALIEFGEQLPQIMLSVNSLIEETGKNKFIGLIIRIIMLCGFRIGQLKYHDLYDSTGLSTLKAKHLKFKGNMLEIKFIGKKGMTNDCKVNDKVVIDELKKLSQDKKNEDFLFTYLAPNVAALPQETKLITAIDVNDWLKAFNPLFTTKFFRTFDVNDKLIDALKNVDPTKLTISGRKKLMKSMIEDISCKINNTPAICKKSYLNPKLIQLFIEQPRKYKTEINDNNLTSRVNFIHFLRRYYSSAASS